MNDPFVRRHVARTTRNLLAVNGTVLLVLALFAAFMLTGLTLLQKRLDESHARLDVLCGRDVLGASAAVDLSRPTPLIGAEVEEARLRGLEGRAVTLNAPEAVNTMAPVQHWIERATGKKGPKGPPSYFVLQTKAANGPGAGFPGGPPPGMINPNGGPAFVIIPADFILPGRRTASTFTGVVRPLQASDRQIVEGLLHAHAVQTPPLPYVLDCLNVGAKRALPPMAKPAPVSGMFWSAGRFLFLFALLGGLSLWNVVKGVRRLRNPSLHLVYARLARYGPAADVERRIEADRGRGSRRLPPAEVTAEWFLAASFWGVDAVPLDDVAWIYRPQPQWYTRYRALSRILIKHTLIALDRFGQGHVVRASGTQLDRILTAVVQGRPWIETGDPNPLRLQYGLDKAGFLAAVEARRSQMTSQRVRAVPPTP